MDSTNSQNTKKVSQANIQAPLLQNEGQTDHSQHNHHPIRDLQSESITFDQDRPTIVIVPTIEQQQEIIPNINRSISLYPTQVICPYCQSVCNYNISQSHSAFTKPTNYKFHVSTHILGKNNYDGVPRGLCYIHSICNSMFVRLLDMCTRAFLHRGPQRRRAFLFRM